ncbi:ModD protein [Roseomonas sp. NAR14]|uniref:Putative pyrophosphorylase ModD n=1 Tax=Roseomonas acroporae TaxID=2937791 RepID=A0A9X1YA05_9PROT|nr:ModD protein [Roseomonas acroporae]MCK8784862.1 ModD protein [Roseomonas acroporae]
MLFLLPDARLQAMLQEDAPYGDMTTQGLGIGGLRGLAFLRAGADMTVCCAEEAERLFLLAGCDTVQRPVASGQALAKGDLVLVAEGDAAALQIAVRTAQVLVEVSSGVATRARRILLAARQANPGIAVACTRKHLPGTKDAMLKAAMAAGCTPHRFGLSESMLVFAHHRVFLGDEAARGWIGRLRAAQPERRIVVEAETTAEALLLAEAGADSIQLDHMTPEQVAETVRALERLAHRPAIVVTGGINEGNAAAYAATGAALLVTSAPYAAPPLDIKVSMTTVPAGSQ